MILPLVLIGLAIVSAGAMAYGTEPGWAQYPHGIQCIMLARRLEWPLVSISILLCLALIALVVAGKRRAWFLIGLGPVIALFAHRFMTQPAGGTIADDPVFLDAESVHSLADGDFVVGAHCGDDDYAYPYAALFCTPVVIHADHERRVMLIWSAYANRAVAMSISRDLKARDLEIVGSPGNSLLLYNGRLGQFINGVTGRTPDGRKPSGALAVIPTWKMTWRAWFADHPQTKVLSSPLALPANAPNGPILPAFPLPGRPVIRTEQKLVALVDDANPSALDSDAIGPQPLNLDIDSTPIFVVREAPDQPLIAFDRRLPNDLRPRFDLATSHRVPAAMFVDRDTNSLWSAQGAWVAGLKELKGKKLTPVPVEDGLYWDVMKFWYPQLTLANDTQSNQSVR